MKHRFYPEIKAGRFCNFKEQAVSVNFLTSCYMFFKFLLRPQKKPFNKQEWLTAQTPVFDQKKTSVIWIGHATFLINIGGLTVLTDPVFFDISALCKRITAPGLAFEQIPKVDVIAISHNHWDHLDIKTLKLIIKRDTPHILVPQGDKKHLEKYHFTQVQEYTWWERQNIAGVEFTFLPCYHWSQRSLFDRNKSLWGSWMISQPSTNTHIYFAGDTAYSGHFAAIAQEFPTITVALMPIGPCEPQEWMKFSHVNAEEAIQGFVDLKAQHFIPMHWGTYYFGTDDTIDPITRLKRDWANRDWANISLEQEERYLHLVKLGEQKFF